MTRRPDLATDLVRIRPRPFTTYIGRGRSVLATTPDGLLDGGPDHGLFVHETRLLSVWRYTIDGVAPAVNAFSPVRQNVWSAYYVTPAPGVPIEEEDQGSGQVPPESQSSLEVHVTRDLGAGMRERVVLTNYTMDPSSFTFAIDVDADFADQAETRNRQQHGERSVSWQPDCARLVFGYEAHRGEHILRRGVDIHLSREARFEDGQLRFDVALEPKESWALGIDVTPRIEGFEHADVDVENVRQERELRIALDNSIAFEAPSSSTRTADVLATVEQARADLVSLRLFDLDAGPDGWTVSAGLPLYIALFGRDALTTGWQAGLMGPEMMRGALHALAATQGTREDDWRDEQPGRMLHEAHTGPLSMLELNPRRRSYGSITTSGLYAFIVAELWHWTGDKTLVRSFVEPALRALQWLDHYGDPDSDGLYEYQSRSPMGPRNQAWKDSSDAIVYEDGRLVEPPIATCEEQAFVHVAKLHLSEMLWWLGEADLSRRLYREAVELAKRFNEAFWMEDEGFFALALDAQKRQVRSIASNAGHCLAAAVADRSLVERTADRLFRPDLFTGWGIRTLSSDHPRYNPYSYHLGSVWPVEHGTFAIGLWRYGLHDRVEQITRAQFDAAALFEYHRLPELFGGHPRDAEHPFPAIYPNANSPQAWSSSAVFSFVQALLGLYPYAPLKMLVVDPHLPEWLPEITLRSLRVGKARVTIRFRRGASGRSSWEILEQEGALHVVRQPTPWSLTTGPAERTHDVLTSFLPWR